MRIPPMPSHPELDALLAKVKDNVITQRDRRSASRWVIGELMLEHPEMTREEAEAIYSRASAQYYG